MNNCRPVNEKWQIWDRIANIHEEQSLIGQFAKCRKNGGNMNFKIRLEDTFILIYMLLHISISKQCIICIPTNICYYWVFLCPMYHNVHWTYNAMYTLNNFNRSMNYKTKSQNYLDTRFSKTLVLVKSRV